MSHWYAISTAPRREAKVHDFLAEKGFAVFLPHETLPRRLGKDIEAVSRPLFPGYLFVRCGPEDFRQILDVDGAQQFVRYMEGGVASPAPFPDFVILRVQIDERAGVFDLTRGKPNAYRPRKGDKVQITAGPYMSFIASVLSTPRGRRAKVLIEGPFNARHKTFDFNHLKAA